VKASDNAPCVCSKNNTAFNATLLAKWSNPLWLLFPIEQSAELQKDKPVLKLCRVRGKNCGKEVWRRKSCSS
jgi:hypothetical protein